MKTSLTCAMPVIVHNLTSRSHTHYAILYGNRPFHQMTNDCATSEVNVEKFTSGLKCSGDLLFLFKIIMSRRRGRGGGSRRRDDGNGFEQSGGYMAAKKAKLEGQFLEDVQNMEEKNEEGIFNGIAIFVNGYTDPTADELKRLMMIHGGTYHHYQSSKTTHVIATNLPDSKVKAIKAGGRNLPICHPRWIRQCVDAGKLLDFRNFQLYTSASPSQPKLAFERPTSTTKDAKDEGFLGEFYNQSRLHHISTMAANMKDYVGDLVNQAPDDHMEKAIERLSSLQRRRPNEHIKDRVIMHIDMDCFFVSVGLLKQPHLRGKPVAVTHSKATKASSMAEVASCSYEARAMGVKNGMFMGTALQKCPSLETIQYEFDEYNRVAKVLYDTVAFYTLALQAVSCDELLADITNLLQQSQLDPLSFANHLRDEIYRLTECTASVGMSHSPLLARLCTKKAKPNGAFYLSAHQVEHFMHSIPLQDMPGVGRATLKKLGLLTTCGGLQKEWPLERLQKQLGVKAGKGLYEHVRGHDTRPFDFSGQHKRKSVSAEVNYGIRLQTVEDLDRFVGQLSQEVSERLQGLKGRGVTVKIMVRSDHAPVETSKFLGHGVCDNMSRSVTLCAVTSDSKVIKSEALKLIGGLKLQIKDLRGLGIQMSKLEKAKTTTNSTIRSKRSSNVGTYYMDLSLSQIDMDVLKQLPDDIRKEIEQQYGSSFDDHVKVDKKVVVLEKRREKLATLDGKRQLEELRPMLQSWIGQCDSPTDVDLTAVTEFLQRLICQDDDLELAYVILRCLTRLVRDKDTIGWRVAFDRLTLAVQTEMVETTGSRLYMEAV